MVIQSGQFKIVEQVASTSAGAAANLIGNTIMPLVAGINKSIQETEQLKALTGNQTTISQALLAASEADPDKALGVFEKITSDYKSSFSEITSNEVREKVEADWATRLSAAELELVQKTGKRQAAFAQDLYKSVLRNENDALLVAINQGNRTDIATALNTYHANIETTRKNMVESNAYRNPHHAENSWNAEIGNNMGNVVGIFLGKGDEHSLAEAETLLESSHMWSSKGQQWASLRAAKTRLNRENLELQATKFNTLRNQIVSGEMHYNSAVTTAFSLINPNDPASVKIAQQQMPSVFHAAIAHGNFESVEEFENARKILAKQFEQYDIDPDAAEAAYIQNLLNSEIEARQEFLNTVAPYVESDTLDIDWLNKTYQRDFSSPITVSSQGVLQNSEFNTLADKERRANFVSALVARERFTNSWYGEGFDTLDVLEKFGTSDGTFKDEGLSQHLINSRSHLKKEKDKREAHEIKVDNVIAMAGVNPNLLSASPAQQAEQRGSQVNGLMEIFQSEEFGSTEKDLLDSKIKGMTSGAQKNWIVSTIRESGEFLPNTEASIYENLMSNFNANGDAVPLIDYLKTMHKHGFAEQMEGVIGEDYVMQLANNSLESGREAELMGLLQLASLERHGNQDGLEEKFKLNHKDVQKSLVGDFPDTDHPKYNFMVALNQAGYAARYGVEGEVFQMGEEDVESVEIAMALALTNHPHQDGIRDRTIAADIVGESEFVSMIKNVSDANSIPVPGVGFFDSRVTEGLSRDEFEVLFSERNTEIIQKINQVDLMGTTFLTPTHLPFMNLFVGTPQEDRGLELINALHTQSQMTNRINNGSWGEVLPIMKSELGNDAYLESENAFSIHGVFDAEQMLFIEGEKNQNGFIITPVYEGAPDVLTNANQIGYQIMEYKYDSLGKAEKLVPLELEGKHGNNLTPGGILSEVRLGVSLATTTEELDTLSSELHALESQLWTMSNIMYRDNPVNRRGRQLDQTELSWQIAEEFMNTIMGGTTTKSPNYKASADDEPN